MAEFDVVVIGSGPGGYRAALLAALRGQRTAIIERATWGGCCLNRGCVPKKDWYYSATLIAAHAHFAQRGLVGSLRGDLTQAWHHQRAVVLKVRDSYTDYLRRLGVTLFTGTAAFTAPGTIQIQPGGDVLTTSATIIATGSAPRMPDGVTIVPGRVIHSDLLFDEPPPSGARVIVIGGGVIALEFAYILRQFGKEVQWFARRAPFTRADFSPAAMAQLQQALAVAGVTARTQALQTVSCDAGGVTVTLADGAVCTSDWVLMATGRRAVTCGLGLASIGVGCDADGFIVIDDHLRTTVPGVYAIGDCVRGPMTANRALYEAAVAVDNILKPGCRTRGDRLVPEAIYSAIELARVGLTEEQAEDAGFEPATGFAAFEVSPQALGQDHPEGFVRVIADSDTGHLLGGEVVGGHAGELIHALAAAPRDGALRMLSTTAYNHPSRSEEFQNAVETLASKWKILDRVFGP